MSRINRLRERLNQADPKRREQNRVISNHLSRLLTQKDVKESLRKTYNEGLKRGITENRVERSHGTAVR